MLQPLEVQNQLQVINFNSSNQLAIYDQKDNLLLPPQQLIEIQLETRPKDMGELNKRLLVDINQICLQNKEDKEVSKKILSHFRKTDAFQDVLHNISLLLPRQEQLSENQRDKKLIAKMSENCNALDRINIDLESLFSNIHDSMSNYKQKLNFLCSQLNKQHDVKTDLGAFIEKYCVYFKIEFDKVKDQGKQIEQIKQQITSIRKQDEMIDLKDINKGLLDIELLKIFSFKNSKVQLSLGQLQVSWVNEITQAQEQYIKQKSFINILSSQKMELQEELKEKIEDQIIQTKYFNQIKQAINEKKNKQLDEDFEKMLKDAQLELDKKKMEASEKLIQLNQINQGKHDKWNNDLLTRIEKTSKFGQSYNFILLVDDSGSMHQKPKNGFWRFLEKTPYRLLSESISQFIKKRKHISESKDIISIVKFSDRAYTICRRQNIGKVDVDLDMRPIKGGTNFNAAFQEAAELMKLQSSGMSSVLIFQTDGFSDNTEQCKAYIEQMRQCDPNLRMFTLALGEDIDEKFLRDLTKFANNNEEILNQGKANPTSFFQKILVADQMSLIFEDISLCIDEQMQELHSQIRLNQSLLELEGDRYKKEVYQIQEQYDIEKQEIDNRIEKIKAINDKKDRIVFLEQELKTQTEKSKQLNQDIHLLEQKIQDLLEKIIQEEKILQIKTDELNHQLEKCHKEIETTRQDKFKEAKEEKEYIYKQIQLFKDMGLRSEADLMLLTISINAFVRYLEIISQFVTKLNQSFNKFKSISSDLQEKIDASSSTSTNDIKYETQEEIVFSYFQGKNSIAEVFNHIYGEQYRNQDDTDEEVFSEALRQILSEFRNMNKFLQGMNFNNPKITDSYSTNKRRQSKHDEEEDEGDDENSSTAIQKLILKVQSKQKNQLSDLELSVSEQAKQFLALKVFNKSSLGKVKNKKGIQKIIESIDEFDFPEEDDDSLSSNDEEEEIDDDEEEAEIDEIEKNHKSKGAKGLKKNKSAAAKKKKKLILSEENVKNLRNQLKIALINKINQIEKNKNLIESIQQLYDAFETRIEQILHRYTKSKKAEQIKIINDYIHEEILQPLDELMNYPQAPNNK